MKKTKSFDEWFEAQTDMQLAEWLWELDTDEARDLLWALYVGRNDLIVKQKKCMIRKIKEHYDSLVYNDDADVTIWED